MVAFFDWKKTMKTYKCRVCLDCYTEIKDSRPQKRFFADTTWFIHYQVDAGAAIDGSIQRVLNDVLRFYLTGDTIRRVLMEKSRIGYQRLDDLDILPYKLFEISIYIEEANGEEASDSNVGLGCAFVRHKGINLKTIIEEAKAKILAQIGEKNNED